MIPTLYSSVLTRRFQPTGYRLAVILLAMLAGNMSDLLFQPVVVAQTLEIPGSRRVVSDDPVLLKAGILYRDGNGKDAGAVYKAYLQKNPRSAEALTGLATIQAREFKFSDAVKTLETALSHHPEDADTAAELGRMYIKWATSPIRGNKSYLARAQEQLKQAKALNSGSPVVLTALGELALAQGDTVAAERNFNNAAKTDALYVPAYQGLTRFYLRMNDSRRAKDTLLHAQELDPKNMENYFLMAQLLAKADLPEKSVEYAMKSEALDFGIWPERDLFLAKELERLGSLEKAITYHEKILKYDPNQVESTHRLAQLYEMTGNRDKSLMYYRKAIALDPSIMTRMIADAENASRLEQSDSAFQHWRRVLTLTPENTEALHYLASLHYLDHFYQRVKTAELAEDLALFDRLAGASPADPLLQLDRLKLEIAQVGEITPEIETRLTALGNDMNDLAAGEALFLTGKYYAAHDRLDAVEGETAKDYLRLADRLLLDQELVSASALYQRGYRLEALPEFQVGLSRIQAKQDLAQKRLDEGNMAFDTKDYGLAAEKYLEATKIYSQWNTAWLRLGDTYEGLKQKADAYDAYRHAVDIQPALLNSKGFAKRYKKLKKAAPAPSPSK